jgi:hypothetical protein
LVTDAACLPACRQGRFAINHSFMFRNFECLLHLFKFYFFLLVTDAASLPAGKFAVNHSFKYQKL